MRIGEIYMIHFHGQGSAQDGLRPGIIIQNNKGNKYSPNIIAVPLTSVMKKRSQPTHVFISKGESKLPRHSIALCENPATLPKSNVGRYVSTLPDYAMKKIAKACLISTPMMAFLDEKEISVVSEEARVINSVA